MFLSVTYCLFPFIIADYAFYITNIIFGMLFTLEFNRILELLDVKEKKHRFIFLMIISNGMLIFQLFYLNQFKYIIGVIILFVLRREIQYRAENIERDLKFYLINYSFFVFAVGIFPLLIFYLLIYIFQDIKFINIFQKDNIKKYVIVILMFIGQNFLFFIFPSYFKGIILLFIDPPYGRNEGIYYLREWLVIRNLTLLSIITSIIIAIISTVLIINNNLKMEQKFSYLSFACIYLSTFGQRIFLILLPLAILLFISFLNQDRYDLDFIKANRILIIGLLSIVAIYFDSPLSVYYEFFPILISTHFIFLLYLRRIVFICILGGSLLILYFKSPNYPKKKEDPISI